ncbi:MAG: hypothetical protein HYV07_21325 [Deltaproteobacteria bacterium]|nr:hypothetical protein [Deltaproteobacteria bacterium]
MLFLALLVSSTPVGLAILNPRCVTESSGSLNAIAALVRSGRLEVTSSGFTVLESANVYVIPERGLSEWEVAPAAVVALTATERVTLDPELPVLVSPYEITFQWPRSSFDWLERITSTPSETATHDVRRAKGVLSRITTEKGSALVLELGGTASSTDALSYSRTFAATSRLSAADDEATFFSVTRPLGSGPRVGKELADWKAVHPEGILIHPGSAVSPWSTPEEREACASEAQRLGLSAMVPRAQELGLGLKGLLELSKRHELPYVAANLEDATAPEGSDRARPFSRFRLFRTRGQRRELVTAVIGIVDPEALGALTAEGRARLRIRDVGVSLAETKEAIFEQLGRYPDLTVVVVGAEGDRALAAVDRAHVDVVIGDFSKFDAVPVRELVQIPTGAREQARHPFALSKVRGGDFGISFVEASFEEGDLGPSLESLRHELRPVFLDGPKDVAMFRRIRALEEKVLPTNELRVLPDVAPEVDQAPELAPLVFGDRIPHMGSFRRYERPSPARLSDPLWMRVVSSALLDELDAEVALARCPKRVSDMIGPLSKMFVDGWLRVPDTIQLIELSGAALTSIGEVIAESQAPTQESAAKWIYAGGFDPSTLRIRGRPIDPRFRYRVAITDDVANLPEIARAVREAAPETRFLETADGWVADAEGSELSLREVVLRRIARWGSASGEYDPQHREDVVEALSDRSKGLRPRWQLRIDDIAVGGSRYEASESSGAYSSTQETRLTTPDNLSLSGKLDVALTYDDEAVAFETRAQAVLDRVLVEIPGVDIPAQEQADDLVAFTELRLVAVSLGAGGAGGIPITPFLRGTFDSELTPTPNPDGGYFSRQKVVRGALGLVARPGKRLREVRIGALLQSDVTEAARHDFGLTFGYVFGWPLFDRVTLESRLDGRWLAKDSDDLARDLAMYLQSPNRLRVDLGRDFSAFVMADVVLAVGKVDPVRELASSLVLGGGLSFSRVFEL